MYDDETRVRSDPVLFGTVDVLNWDTVLHRAAAANAITFLDFLKILANRYLDKQIVLVLDNTHIHHAKMVRDFLHQKGNWFHFIFLPPYSPQPSPLEFLWKWLKDAVIANVFHKDQVNIDSSITRFIDYIDGHPEEVLRRLGCAA